MSRVVLSIGSNLGDRLTHLQSVLDALGDRVVACSSVYSTAPWGGVEQQDFLNATLIAEDDDRDCRTWLRAGQELERAAERVRLERWGPRTLDVDVITCADVVSDDPELTLPHPRAHQRAFVLVPWLEIEPGAQLAGRSVRDLVDRLTPDEVAGVTRTEFELLRGGA